MSALSESNRITIIEARTLARADSREELIDALSLCESPSVVGRTVEDLARVRLSELHSAAFGTLSAIVEELADTLEQLAAEVDKSAATCPHRCMIGRDCGGCGCDGCGRSNLAAPRTDSNTSNRVVPIPPAPWAVWRVDEGTGMARELHHLPRADAEALADQLNRDRKRPVHFLALPIGGAPFDIPDEARNPWHVSAPAGS